MYRLIFQRDEEIKESERFFAGIEKNRVQEPGYWLENYLLLGKPVKDEPERYARFRDSDSVYKNPNLLDRRFHSVAKEKAYDEGIAARGRSKRVVSYRPSGSPGPDMGLFGEERPVF